MAQQPKENNNVNSTLQDEMLFAEHLMVAKEFSDLFPNNFNYKMTKEESIDALLAKHHGKDLSKVTYYTSILSQPHYNCIPSALFD